MPFESEKPFTKRKLIRVLKSKLKTNGVDKRLNKEAKDEIVNQMINVFEIIILRLKKVENRTLSKNDIRIAFEEFDKHKRNADKVLMIEGMFKTIKGFVGNIERDLEELELK